MKQNVTICLWVDNEAEEMANFYTSVFKDSKMGRIIKYPEAAQEVSGKEPGSVMTAEFDINGTHFMALNGGKVPGFELTSATSFIISCDTQEEIDHLWEKLSADPDSEQCGWLKDKFGVTWQIVPTILDDLLASGDKEVVERVTAAFMPMKKLDIAKIEAAAEGK